MTERRFRPGLTENVEGIWFRLVPGKKGDGDLRLELRAAGEWRPVKMRLAAFLTDFFVENEDHLRQYRPHWKQSGWEFFADFLHEATENGWKVASERLETQRRRVVPTDPSQSFDGDFDAVWQANEQRR